MTQQETGAIRYHDIAMPAATLSKKQTDELLTTLKLRFESNMNHHKGLEWAKVQARLEAKPSKLWSLNEMERTGGEPDVVGHDKKTGEYAGWPTLSPGFGEGWDSPTHCSAS